MIQSFLRLDSARLGSGLEPPAQPIQRPVARTVLSARRRPQSPPSLFQESRFRMTVILPH
eukprot:755365-Hanusia_phi.AAC.1